MGCHHRSHEERVVVVGSPGESGVSVGDVDLRSLSH